MYNYDTKLYLGILFIFASVIGSIKSQEYHLKKVWETDQVFLKPESVIYDSIRQRIYISNYNKFTGDGETPEGFISIVSPGGKITELRWIPDLKAPTGLCIYSDFLFIVERDGISKYRLDNGMFVLKHRIQNTGFLNDLVIDQEGTIYFTVSSPDKTLARSVGMVKNGNTDSVINSSVSRANGILLQNGNLIVGNTGNRCLEKISLKNYEISTFIRLDTGIIDGIKPFKNESYLVSHCEGSIYKVSSGGEIHELLNLQNQDVNIADFEFIDELNLLVIPTMKGNKVIAYRIEEE